MQIADMQQQQTRSTDKTSLAWAHFPTLLVSAADYTRLLSALIIQSESTLLWSNLSNHWGSARVVTRTASRIVCILLHSDRRSEFLCICYPVSTQVFINRFHAGHLSIPTQKANTHTSLTS